MPTSFYGPPGFGEDPKHDERGTYPVLHLDRNLRLCRMTDADGQSAGTTDVRNMQMIFYRGPFGKPWYGKRVIVTAKLFPWDNAFHHTPVMLEVVKIQAENASK